MTEPRLGFKLNKQHHIDCRKGLKKLPDESIDMGITSSPYYNLRDYDVDPTIWDGDPECEHQWDIKERTLHSGRGLEDNKNQKYSERETIPDKIISNAFCSKCGAWKGKLGLEPSIDLFIKHLCDIFEEFKRVLKPYGSLWVNLGDSYSTQGGQNRNTDKDYSQYNSIKLTNRMIGVPLIKPNKLPSKCLCLIPFRFAIEMCNRGWIIRNVIIWKKNNCLPSSSRDRFTNDFEYLFWFVKNTKKPLYWVNKKTMQLTTKKPKGIHGLEGIDWDWEECSKCEGKGYITQNLGKTKIPNKTADSYNSPRARYQRYKKGKCKSCKGTGKRKKSYWKGRDYYFEQQFEKSTTELEKTKNYNSKYSKSEHGQTLQGFIRNQSIQKERELSRINAKKLFPNDKKKQQEYINYVHDHGFTIDNKRNKRCVWTINTIPHSESHFAVFPNTLIETPIKACCPEFVCKKCGMPREKILKNGSLIEERKPEKGMLSQHPEIQMNKYTGLRKGYKQYEKIVKGYTDCGCNAGYKHGIVLDPFSGIGTTIETAFKLGRDGIGFDISEKYCKIAEDHLPNICNFKRLTEFI